MITTVCNADCFYLGSQISKEDQRVAHAKDPSHAIRKSSLERDTRPKVKVSSGNTIHKVPMHIVVSFATWNLVNSEE